jgi:hypothetical protein
MDTLLPPFSEARQHVPAASLHRLLARLRGTAEPPVVSTPELLYILQPYEVDVPSRVLQHLVTRAATGAPQSASAAITSEEVDPERTAFELVPFEGADDSLDEYPCEQIPRTPSGAPQAQGGADGPSIPDAPEATVTADVPSRPFSRLVRWVRIRLAGREMPFLSGRRTNESSSPPSLS